ncbi:MAG: radical SAM protein [Oligoflexia bacterium]|nr:radical SAM protein [Oligoflexia bacterium]MBF0364350.1 radical SAM protein [Oligoflexia bacterium]
MSTLFPFDKDPFSLEQMEQEADQARLLTLERFGKSKGVYIPLYISNFCENSCTYCGFNKNNTHLRKTLLPKEIEQELLYIYKRGYRHVLLVAGEVNNEKYHKLLVESVALATRIGMQAISVEFGSISDQLMLELLNAGADCFVLYQETYHQEQYKKYHTAGRKSDYHYRIHSIERAIKAGFKKVTLGILGGLAPIDYDAKALFEHLSFIKQNYWDVQFSLSIPRINSAEGGIAGDFPLSDIDFTRTLIAFRLCFPEMPILLSTRERPEMRDGLLRICITHLSVESMTAPGGYSNSNDCAHEELKQFNISDHRSFAEMAASLARFGFDLHTKDWQMELNKGVFLGNSNHP